MKEPVVWDEAAGAKGQAIIADSQRGYEPFSGYILLLPALEGDGP